MTQFVELSHPIEHGMTTYKGLPGPMIEDFLGREESQAHYEPGTSFQIGSIQLVANTGTYVDAPFHRFADGVDLAGLPLSSLASIEGIVFRVAADTRAIEPDIFADHDLKGKAVLVHTGWSRHWRTEEYLSGRHPYLTAATARHLKESAVTLVGIDSYNIDSTDDGSRPVHTTLLGSGIPVVEHLRGLEDLPDRGFRFFAIPPPIKGMGTFPVRAFAIIN